MISKRLLLGLLTIFSLFLVSGLVSAAVTIDNFPSTLSAQTSSTVSVPFNLTNTNDSTYSALTWTLTDSATVGDATLGTLTSSILNNTKLPLTAQISVPSNHQLGTSTLTLTVSNGTTLLDSETISLSVTKKTLGLCENGAVGTNLSITDIDIQNSGDKDDEWKFLDEITIDVDVENIGDTDMDNVVVEFALLDSTGDNFVGDLDFTNADEEDYDLGDLNDRDEETATFEFTVPADMDSGDYKVVIRAYSKEIDDSIVCAEEAGDDISVEQESDEGKFIAFTNTDVTPREATCGDSVTLTTDVYNVGDEDQDRVKITLSNKELGIDQTYEITSDLDQGDKQKVTFAFDIPNTASDKLYRLALFAEYDYRNGVYREESDDDTLIPLTLLGCSGSATPGRIASISASLDSEAVAGESMIVTATIRNLGASVATFTINADNYESWADLEEVSPETLTLNPGESDEVTLEFAVNKDASGDESFTIEATSNGKTESREVQVSFSEGSKTNLSSLFGNNSLIWVIGLVNLILIILIIVVAVKLSRR